MPALLNSAAAISSGQFSQPVQRGLGGVWLSHSHQPLGTQTQDVRQFLIPVRLRQVIAMGQSIFGRGQAFERLSIIRSILGHAPERLRFASVYYDEMSRAVEHALLAEADGVRLQRRADELAVRVAQRGAAPVYGSAHA